MRIGDELYFAPGIRFSDLDKSGDKLPEQFDKRIRGYYLNPAIVSAKSGHAFASGVILVSCIDALAYFYTGIGDVGERFRSWCIEFLPSFSSEKYASYFYRDFRNGLIHNARIKNGGEFTLDINCTMKHQGTIISINPLYLASEIDKALSRYIDCLRSNTGFKNKFVELILKDFKFELKE